MLKSKIWLQSFFARRQMRNVPVAGRQKKWKPSPNGGEKERKNGGRERGWKVKYTQGRTNKQIQKCFWLLLVTNDCCCCRCCSCCWCSADVAAVEIHFNLNKNEFQAAAAAAAAQLYFCAQFSCTDFDLLNLTAGAQQQQQQQQL